MYIQRFLSLFFTLNGSVYIVYCCSVYKFKILFFSFFSFLSDFCENRNTVHDTPITILPPPPPPASPCIRCDLSCRLANELDWRQKHNIHIDTGSSNHHEGSYGEHLSRSKFCLVAPGEWGIHPVLSGLI